MFDLRKQRNGLPLLIGHRGAPMVAPENSMYSFEAACAAGADMIELDVQLSADGEVMIFHDIDLCHKTGVKGQISDFTAGFLQTLDIGSWFDPKFANARIPRLNDVLAWAKNKIPLMIELKHEPVTDDALEERVAQLIKEYDMQDEVVIISFDQFALQRIKQFLPDVAVSLQYVGRFIDPLKLVDEIPVDALSPATNFLTPEEVRMIHDAGYACSPGGLWWDYKILAEWGVDTVSSNDPASVEWR